LQVANAAIRPNARQFSKVLRPDRKETDLKPALVPLLDNNQQAVFVAQRILELRDEGVDLEEIAVLYRSHFQSLEVQLALTRAGIPYSITSGLRFFEQAHIKDVAAFMKFVTNPSDEVAFKRMVRLLPGIAARSAEKLWDQINLAPSENRKTFSAWLEVGKAPAKSQRAWEQLRHTLDEIAPEKQPVPPSSMIHSILEAVYDDYLKSKYSNHEQRREDLTALENFARGFKEPVEFLSQLSLMATGETEQLSTQDEDRERVTLSTVHQAKGLEWQAVFIVWLTDGMFPSARSLESNENVEEERRLFYVAITRAKDQLYFLYPSIWPNGNIDQRVQRPSRFLGEIPGELCEEWRVGF
jgi:DNA helicase II / ATP-dependent DNA helicase PcrA